MVRPLSGPFGLLWMTGFHAYEKTPVRWRPQTIVMTATSASTIRSIRPARSGITAVILGVLGLLNAEQQRRHEVTLNGAVRRPGEVIVWNSGGAVGTVATMRSGVSSSGWQCREYQQTVTVDGRTEQAYGTACLQPDGHWEIVNAQ